MELNIEGNTGTHNNYQENQIGNVEQFNANPKEVNNNHATVVNISLSITFNIDGDSISKVMKKVKQKFDLLLTKSISSHFDGEGTAEKIRYQFNGIPTDMLAVLKYISNELGETSIDSIRYISKQEKIEINNLTLSQAVQAIEYESGL